MPEAGICVYVIYLPIEDTLQEIIRLMKIEVGYILRDVTILFSNGQMYLVVTDKTEVRLDCKFENVYIIIYHRLRSCRSGKTQLPIVTPNYPVYG